MIQEKHGIDEAGLQKMSYEELVQLEDALMLENELNTELRIRSTGGRFIIFAFGAILWFIIFSAVGKYAQTINENTRPLFTFPALFITLGLSVGLAHFIWKVIGVAPRMFMRYALHYWPVVFAIVGISLSVRMKFPA